MKNWIDYLNIASELIFPGFCVLCGTDLLYQSTRHYPLCRSCTAPLLRARLKDGCRICHRPLLSEIESCLECRGKSFSFGYNRSLFPYRGEVKELIYQYKFNSKKRLAKFFARLMAPLIRSQYSGYTLVTVPAGKPNPRGWDQMEKISSILKLHYHLPVKNLLKRKRSSSQKYLSKKDRSGNLKGRIFLPPFAQRRLINEEKILLLDDIFTTGATSEECTSVLLNSGVKKVDVLTIARD